MSSPDQMSGWKEGERTIAPARTQGARSGRGIIPSIDKRDEKMREQSIYKQEEITIDISKFIHIQED